jgi:hypothetical protein
VAHPQIAAFARLANGDAKPTRAIAGQHSLITRSIHDMAYNPLRDEIVITQFYAGAIMTYRGGANGDEAPIRIIHGPDTQMTNPMRLALDPVHKEVFVPIEDRVLVFPSEAEGDIVPIRVIKGPNTSMNLGDKSVAVDPLHNLLIVTGMEPRRGNGEGGNLGRGMILIFNRTDDGNVKPRAIISGPNSQLHSTGLVTVYPPREWIIAASRSSERSSPDNFAGVWSEHDNGDVPPHWTIGGPNGELRQLRGITLDEKHKSVILSDKYVNAVLTYYFPEIF